MRLVSQRPLPGVAPIRTVRATFTAHGSSLYDATFGDTAISVLSGLSSLHQQVHQLDRLGVLAPVANCSVRMPCIWVQLVSCLLADMELADEL